MEKKKTYQCKTCRKAVYGEAEDVPECCGEEMAVVGDPNTCTQSSTAEHARAGNNDEPCDDGRAG